MKIFKNTYSDKDKYCGIAVDDCDYVLRNEDESIKITAVKSTIKESCKINKISKSSCLISPKDLFLP